jgi:hypothetical protein
MKKNVKLRATETSATNSDFYNLFRPIAPSIDIIGKVAQIISALTEGVTIWYITQSEMVGTSKLVSILVSIVAMVLVIAVLELGGRKFLQVLTRAIVWKRLENAWYIALFTIVTAITLGMGILSFNLSTNGIHHAFVSNVPTVAHFNDATLKGEYRNSVKEISTRYDSDFKMIQDNYEDRVKSTADKYDARIDAANIKVDAYNRKYKSGEKWAKSQALKYSKKANVLETAKTSNVSSIQAEHSKKLDAWQAKKDKAIQAEKASMVTSIAKNENTLTKVHDSKSKDAAFWGNLFSFFVGFSVILAFVCIVSVEVFRRGSGIEVTYEEEEQDDSILEIIWNGLKARLDAFFRSKAERFAGMPARVKQNGIGGAGEIGYNFNRGLATNEAKDNFTASANQEDEYDF